MTDSWNAYTAWQHSKTEVVRCAAVYVLALDSKPEHNDAKLYDERWRAVCNAISDLRVALKTEEICRKRAEEVAPK